MDTKAIQKICFDYMEYLKSDEYFEDNNWENYIYETVMKAVFGAGIWERIKRIHQERAIKAKRDEINKLQSEIERLA